MCSRNSQIDEEDLALHGLNESEKWWRDQYDVLKSHGYELRPRFRPGWTPSWIRKRRDPMLCEDGHPNFNAKVIDAVRISDKARVAIKRLSKRSIEVAIAKYLNSEELIHDPRNHTVPVLDVISKEDENVEFLVMPLLIRFNIPPFSSIDEVVDFMKQALEGLVFMHEHGVAHRDCSFLNIMMDGTPLYPRGFHYSTPVFDSSGSGLANPRHRRDVPSVKYYYTDFGISSHFDASDASRLVTGKECQDKELPELYQDEPYDPFAVDVFLLGNLFRRALLERYNALAFLSPLTEAMTQADPEARPSAHAALQLLHEIIERQHPRYLLQLMASKDANKWAHFFCSVGTLRREMAITIKCFLPFTGAK